METSREELDIDVKYMQTSRQELDIDVKYMDNYGYLIYPYMRFSAP